MFINDFKTQFGIDLTCVLTDPQPTDTVSDQRKPVQPQLQPLTKRIQRIKDQVTQRH